MWHWIYNEVDPLVSKQTWHVAGYQTYTLKNVIDCVSWLLSGCCDDLCTDSSSMLENMLILFFVIFLFTFTFKNHFYHTVDEKK